MREEIFVTRPYLPPMEEYMEYIRQIWDSRQLTNMGPLWREFADKLSDFLDAKYCMPLTNGHMALELTIQAFELSGEVITTPFTFASTTHAIVRNGLTPVFCDIRRSDCTIDPEKIEELITDKTSAIVPVHVYGMPCDVEAIERIAGKHNLKVIYDAAHAFGEKIKGRNISSFGDAAIFSFHATKSFNSIEGGCTVVRDKATLIRAYQLHNFGIMDEESVEFVGANAKMNEFQAALGLCNLKHIDENLAKRKALFDIYKERLSAIPGIRMLDYDEENIEYNYSYLPVFINKDEYGEDRNEVYDRLLKNKVHVRNYFYPLTNDFACYKDKNFRGDTKIGR